MTYEEFVSRYDEYVVLLNKFIGNIIDARSDPLTEEEDARRLAFAPLCEEYPEHAYRMLDEQDKEVSDD